VGKLSLKFLREVKFCKARMKPGRREKRYNSVFLELAQIIEDERPKTLGFQHTEYANSLFNIGVRYKSKLYQEDIARVRAILFREAEAYRRQYASLINNETWRANMKELSTMLDPCKFPSRLPSQEGQK
jgi:hypothetical protein